MRHWIWITLVMVVACGATPVSRAEVQLSEFTVSPSSTTFRPGEVDLRVHNSGEFGHTLVITDSEGDVIDAGEYIPPSGDTSVTLDLDPGQYNLTCRIVGQDGDGNVIDHYERGMVAAITVGRS